MSGAPHDGQQQQPAQHQLPPPPHPHPPLHPSALPQPPAPAQSPPAPTPAFLGRALPPLPPDSAAFLSRSALPPLPPSQQQQHLHAPSPSTLAQISNGASTGPSSPPGPAAAPARSALDQSLLAAAASQLSAFQHQPSAPSHPAQSSSAFGPAQQHQQPVYTPYSTATQQQGTVQYAHHLSYPPPPVSAQRPYNHAYYPQQAPAAASTSSGPSYAAAAASYHPPQSAYQQQPAAPLASAPGNPTTAAPQEPTTSMKVERTPSQASLEQQEPPVVRLPSFVTDEPPSEVEDSSSDEDSDGEPKQNRTPLYDRLGQVRPRPAYYYDGDYDPGAASGAKKRRRRGGHKGVPVFMPSLDDFANSGGFYGYVKRIEKYGMRSGIVKVIPPKEWTESLPSPLDHLRPIRLREPIEQIMQGHAGQFLVTNVAKSRIWNAAQWKDMVDSDKYMPPDFVAKVIKEHEEQDDLQRRADVAAAESSAAAAARGSGRGRGGRGRGRGRGGRTSTTATMTQSSPPPPSSEADDTATEADVDADADPDAHGEDESAAASPARGRSARGRAGTRGRGRGRTRGHGRGGRSSAAGRDAATTAAAASEDEGAAMDHGDQVVDVQAPPTPDAEAEERKQSPTSKAEQAPETQQQQHPPTPAGDSASSRHEPSPPSQQQAQQQAREGSATSSSAPRDHPATPEDHPLHAPPTPQAEPMEVDQAKAAATPSKAVDEPAPPPSSAQKKSDAKRPTVLQRAEVTDEQWAEFARTYDDLPYGRKKEDYTPEVMREVERAYWRNLMIGKPPMYGADMKGSIFSDETTAWNVASLGDILPKLMPPSCKIPGVVSPYLYFGSWRATFAWHVEDADLYSINYIHFGAPKFWYSVPQEQSDRFERVMASMFPQESGKCSQFLRHKAFLASPRVLANSGITLNRCAQLPGEFILTYPRGYHSGFNLGYNCAESINFATERWLPIGRAARACDCVEHSVSIDVDSWLTAAADAENGFFHEPGAAPASAAPRRPRPSKPAAAAANKRLSQIKTEEEEPPRKKARTSVSVEPSEGSPAPGAKAKSTASSTPYDESFPCALCPDRSTDGLVTIGEPGVKHKRQLAAHRVCVMFTPATWIEHDEQAGEERVRGFGKIEKARWKLKCQYCTEKHGTKVQCTKGKCPKAIHVTCGLREESGFLLNATIVEPNTNNVINLIDIVRDEIDAKKAGEDVGPSKVAVPPPDTPTEPAPAHVSASDPDAAAITEAGGIRLTVLCRTHNPEWQKRENDRKAAELRARVEAMPRGELIRVRTSGGVFEVRFDGALPERESVAIVYADGKRASLRWKAIVWPDSPSEIQRRRNEEAAERARKAEDVYVWEERRSIQPTKRSAAFSEQQTLAPVPAQYPPFASAPYATYGMPQRPAAAPTAGGFPSYGQPPSMPSAPLANGNGMTPSPFQSQPPYYSMYQGSQFSSTPWANGPMAQFPQRPPSQPSQMPPYAHAAYPAFNAQAKQPFAQLPQPASLPMPAAAPAAAASPPIVNGDPVAPPTLPQQPTPSTANN